MVTKGAGSRQAARRVPLGVAVEMRVSRIHCSLAVQVVCPSCGAVGMKINRQMGVYLLRTERYHLKKKQVLNETLERERTAVGDSAELKAVRRKRDKMGQCNSRCAGSTG